jgi:hypothetical protein
MKTSPSFPAPESKPQKIEGRESTNRLEEQEVASFVQTYIDTLVSRVADNGLIPEEIAREMLKNFLQIVYSRKKMSGWPEKIDTKEFIPNQVSDTIEYPKSAEEPVRELVLKALNAEDIGKYMIPVGHSGGYTREAQYERHKFTLGDDVFEMWVLGDKALLGNKRWTLVHVKDENTIKNLLSGLGR